MLKDRVLTYQDILAIGPDDTPSVYIPLDWTGTLQEVMPHTEISLKARNWIIMQFFNPHYSRLCVLRCIERAAEDLGISAHGKMSDFIGRLEAALNDEFALALLHEEILAENQVAWTDFADDMASLPKAYYARLICALKWTSAGDWTMARMNTDIAMLDVLIYSTPEICNQYVLEILDIHP